MKKALTISILLVICWMGALNAQVQHFTWQGTEREYLIRVPSQHTGPLPVMFFLHGLGDNITNYDQTFNFGQIAEEFGWAIVAPQALNQGIGAMWNAGLMASSIDDAGFLMALGQIPEPVSGNEKEISPAVTHQPAGRIHLLKLRTDSPVALLDIRGRDEDTGKGVLNLEHSHQGADIYLLPHVELYRVGIGQGFLSGRTNNDATLSEIDFVHSFCYICNAQR